MSAVVGNFVVLVQFLAQVLKTTSNEQIETTPFGAKPSIIACLKKKWEQTNRSGFSMRGIHPLPCELRQRYTIKFDTSYSIIVSTSLIESKAQSL
jgi:hypothetical protein